MQVDLTLLIVYTSTEARSPSMATMSSLIAIGKSASRGLHASGMCNLLSRDAAYKP